MRNKDRVLIQVRLPATLVAELDRLLKEGYYRDRTEAIADAIRHLIERFDRLDRVGRLIRLYLMKKLPRDSSIMDIGEAEDVDKVRRAFKERYGTDDLDKILEKIRGREV
ncbi:MAG: ribbon-helix-helix domain-containing protein [Candidatus Njordarchaeales archaeon]